MSSSATFAKIRRDRTSMQHNHGCSQMGVLRGIRFQQLGKQGKFVRPTQCDVLGIALDLRSAPPAFRHSMGIEQSADDKWMLWGAKDFARRFLALDDDTDFLYASNLRSGVQPEHSMAGGGSAPENGWPLEEVVSIISEKDARGTSFADAAVFA